ncbi:MAG: helix-turn-helix transcriptional regulator [Limisphaerales bacterium]
MSEAKAPSLANTLHSRPPLWRMLRIHQAIQSGKHPNAAYFAREFEVSAKTIHRDLDFMRYQLDLPIEYNPQRFGFFYSEKVDAFPTLQITEGEFIALVIAERALEQYRGTDFEKPLLSAIRKMQQALPDTISLNLADIQQTISFRTRAEPILNLDIFDSLAKATAARQQLQLTYRKPGQAAAEPRVVDPYHLANINGDWFLFGYDHLRKDIRTFVPARIQRIKPTGKTFSRPGTFSLEKRLRDSFGVHSGQGAWDVVIRFDPCVADFVREKRWHPSQELRELKDGGLEMRMRLSSLSEVERWVLSWAGNAVVVQPPELAGSVRQAAEKILRSTLPGPSPD